MAKLIKGLTIQIGAETTKLDKALKDSEARTRSACSELRQINNILKTNGDSAEMWRQKQTVLTQALEASRDKLKVLHTPGHSDGGICLVTDGLVFSGDTLFAESIGRCDFPGGSEVTLIRAIKDKLMPLPDDTKVLPGHGPGTTIGWERKCNPFLQF